MDFFSEKELVTQAGHPREEWHLVFVKEMIDNALDACEEADIAPVIDVTADAGGITVADNGPGLPESTLKSAMDFSARVSNREAYVAPDRGAQGNAFKTILAMPKVLDPEHGKLIVEAHGKRHEISCDANPISQRAEINDDATAVPTIGTKVRIEWQRRSNGRSAVWPFEDILADCHQDDVLRIIEGFALFNTHASFRLDWFGHSSIWEATDPKWQKWKPHRPTSAHWYEPPHMERLIGAYVTHDVETGSDRLVSDFVGEFDGLTGSQKRSQILRETGLHRVRLRELVVNGRLDSERIAKLLASMQRHTRPVNPKLLGIIGEEHFRARLLAMGIVPDSFSYVRKLAKCKKQQRAQDDKACFTDELPGVLEVAFGWLGDDAFESRHIHTGVNWSAAIHNPFRSFGSGSDGLEGALGELKVGEEEPVVIAVHLAQPRIEYTDRGKSAVVIGGKHDD